MKLIKLFVSINPDGWRYRYDEIEVVDKLKVYSGEGHRIPKDKLMKVQSLVRPEIRVFMFCLPEDITAAVDKCKKHVKVALSVETDKYNSLTEATNTEAII